MRPVAFAVLFSLFCSGALAQGRALSLERIYDPRTKENFSGVPQRDFVWIDDTRFIWPKSDASRTISSYSVVNAATGAERPLFSAATLRDVIGRVSEKGMTPTSSRRRLEFNPAKDAVLLPIESDLYLYSITGNKLTRLTDTPALEEEAAFSPDGKQIAFVRENNLFVVSSNGGETRQLTTDGNPQLLNGKLDWVYQEEIYGRGKFRAHWWSPDSSSIAFLQLDETPVPEFTVVDHIPYRQELEVIDYPKAGDPNPLVRLFVVDVKSGQRRRVDDSSKYAGREILFVDVSWSPGNEVVYQVQDREQTWLELNTANRVTGASRTVLRETTLAWVDAHGSPEWLNDGTFLWFSERSGYKHLYHFRPDGSLIRQITDGPWEVRTYHGTDQKTRWIYFSGTERSVIGSDVYRIRLDGSGLTRLSTEPGTHTAQFSPGLTWYLDTWSDVSTPVQVHLHRANGTRVRTVDPNTVGALQSYTLTRPEFVQVRTRDGFVMEAMMFRPPGFDPSRKYPVYQHAYGGPHAQQVRNAWSESHLFHQLLAQNGIIVWILDNRTASGKGAVSAWPAYKSFGETELRDIEDGIAWLKGQTYIDPSRIMINGWSYGGFVVTYALTHGKSFIAGIAGGSVTDWRDYDSIYTERFMLMPENNEEGYRRSSPRFAAENLHGNLLLLHGLTDDNVHVQNTIQFAYELQKAGKKFEMMLYPRTRHGVTDRDLVFHMRSLMLDFVLRNLKP